MSHDKIDEIRKRHNDDERLWEWRGTTNRPEPHEDRGYLLADNERLIRERDAARTEIERLRAEIERLREVLQSIAKNTCCNSCQEAARVARKALENKKLNAYADTLAALDSAMTRIDKEDGR